MFNRKLPYVIAEVGSNHLGIKKLAKQSIILAKKAGANCVKFQLFNENNLVNKKLKVYKHVSDKSLKYQYERFKKVKITIDYLKILSKQAKKNKIDFCVTPFDHNYVKKIKNYVSFFKVASGDINNYLLLKEISKTRKKVVISTGMSNLNEIKKALSFFPKNKVTLLHCISSYPTLKKDANLINISYLKKRFKVSTGYSDHVPGIETAAKSIFFGAEVIEKHFMPKKTKLAGDYKLSVDFIDLKKLINLIKENFEIIGSNRKKYFNCEKYGIKTLRRSIYFFKNLKKGDKIKKNDIILLRPFNSTGVKIKDLNKILGTSIKKEVKKNQLLTYKVLRP
jgi:N,N'-diacetyllegionaminate synthase